MLHVFIKAAMVSILLLSLTILNAQTTSKEQLTVELSKPDKPLKLTAGLHKGSIVISAYTGKEVLIEAEPVTDKTEKGGTNQNQNINSNINVNVNEYTPSQTETKTKTTKGKYVTITENNNSVSIRANNPTHNLRLLIKIPQSTVKLNLSITSEGAITAIDIAGELEINNTNGSVTLNNITGSALVTTETGNITATFKSVEEKSPMAFSTVVGKIDVRFPASLKANLKTQTDAGGLYSDYDILFDGVKPFVTIVNAPCLYQIKSNENLSGRVNGGGPEILFRAIKGDVYLRKMK